MIRRAVVIDTNVIISAHLTSRPESPTVWILDAMIAARFSFLVSVELLAEYRRVLLRQPIREKHGVSANKVDRLLTEIALNGIVVEPTPTSASPPDAGDQHLWDLLAARPGAVLVTGDTELLRSPPQGASVLSPRAFVELATRP
jgi:putative PIN family toxin of toxin-antitoxin system